MVEFFITANKFYLACSSKFAFVSLRQTSDIPKRCGEMSLRFACSLAS